MHVAVVGLRFGRAFVPLYKNHPAVTRVSLCETNEAVLREIAAEFGIENATTELRHLLDDKTIDAVHLLTPVPLHVEHTLAVLAAGKHCACAVPMATDLEGIRRIIQAVESTRKTYMMMETAVYTREFLYAREMRDRGLLGPITFLQADYFQDLEAPYYADYWKRVPPMHYATHAIAPLLALADTSVARVSCLGAGSLRPDIGDDPKNPFPMQTAHFRLQGSAAVAQVNRAWYQTARPYVESFSVYGERGGFEWQQLEHEDPLVFELPAPKMDDSWRDAKATRIHPPFRPDRYPSELAPYVDGGHSGSHPHLVHEFLSAVLERRPAAIDARTAAAWTAPGICAHESSLRLGECVDVPHPALKAGRGHAFGGSPGDS